MASWLHLGHRWLRPTRSPQGLEHVADVVASQLVADRLEVGGADLVQDLIGLDVTGHRPRSLRPVSEFEQRVQVSAAGFDGRHEPGVDAGVAGVGEPGVSGFRNSPVQGRQPFVHASECCPLIR